MGPEAAWGWQMTAAAPALCCVFFFKILCTLKKKEDDGGYSGRSGPGRELAGAGVLGTDGEGELYSRCTRTQGLGRGEHDLYSSSSHGGGVSSDLAAMASAARPRASSAPAAMASSAPTQTALASAALVAMASSTPVA